MNLLDRFNQRFGFTRNESLVVLFLSGTLLLGGVIKLTKDLVGTTRFDYSETDEEFALRSAAALTAGFDSAANRKEVAGDPQDQYSSPASQRSSKLKAPPETRININRATKSELMRLPGIGEVTAEHIIMYRQDNGPFRSPEDLKGVKGIGKRKAERLVPFVTFDSTASRAE